MKVAVLAMILATRGVVAPEEGTIAEGAPIEVGASAWAELETIERARLRISAGSRLWLTKSATTSDPAPAIHLARGRVWVQVPRALQSGLLVQTETLHVWITSGSSVIVDHSTRDGTTVITRRGRAEAGRAVIGHGQLARGSDSDGVMVRPGGGELADLVVMEARAALGDPVELEAFLLARVAASPVGALDVRRVAAILRLTPEIIGADGGMVGAALEDAIRPAPFFEDEVPSKGPNVVVEVDFAGR